MSRKDSKNDNKAINSNEDRLEDALDQLPPEKLKEIARSYAGESRRFRSQLLAKAQVNKDYGTQAEYRQVVRDAIEASRGKHGFIGYWAAFNAIKGAEIVLEKADKYRDMAEYSEALLIYQVVLEEMVRTINEGIDDSGGNAGMVIDQALQGLEICARALDGDKEREELFAYLLKEADSKKYEGWDWHWELLRMTAPLVETDGRQKRLFSRIDKLVDRSKGKEWKSNYDAESAVKIKMEILEQRGLSNERYKLIEKNIHLPKIRRLAIERVFAEGELDKAKELALAGLEQAEKTDYPGLERDWLVWLLKIAKKKKDKEEIREYTIRLFKHSGDMLYYDQLKKFYTETEWEKEVEGFIRFFSSRRPHDDTIGQIYVREQRWKDLLEFINSQRKNMGVLYAYHNHLVKHYPVELAKMYREAIMGSLNYPGGREAYRHACDEIKQMKKCNVNDEVKGLVEEIKTKYANRPALLDELKKSKL
ncbi:MAG: hypothetical protein KC713_07735 [Candidatus Omnitrophica bacterium]|nr:hypothetical protein [Candidatus Omnitrophota bacterium]